MSRNQADFMKVDSIVIKTIERHWGAAFDADALDDYVRTLAKFDENALRKAMTKMIEEHKRKPTLAHIIDACKEQKSSGSSISDPNNPNHPWVQVQKQVDKLVDDYLAQYKNISQLWRDAVRERWELDLERYIRAVAEIQAAMIVGQKNYGWKGPEILGINTIITSADKHHFFQEQKRIAAGGSIDVGIPTNRVDDWRRGMVWQAQQSTEQKQVAKKAHKSVLTSEEQARLDQELSRAPAAQGFRKLPEIQF